MGRERPRERYDDETRQEKERGGGIVRGVRMLKGGTSLSCFSFENESGAMKTLSGDSSAAAHVFLSKRHETNKNNSNTCYLITYLYSNSPQLKCCNTDRGNTASCRSVRHHTNKTTKKKSPGGTGGG